MKLSEQDKDTVNKLITSYQELHCDMQYGEQECDLQEENNAELVFLTLELLLETGSIKDSIIS